jgi:hypothetical protein
MSAPWGRGRDGRRCGCGMGAGTVARASCCLVETCRTRPRTGVPAGRERAGGKNPSSAFFTTKHKLGGFPLHFHPKNSASTQSPSPSAVSGLGKDVRLDPQLLSFHMNRSLLDSSRMAHGPAPNGSLNGLYVIPDCV